MQVKQMLDGRLRRKRDIMKARCSLFLLAVLVLCCSTACCKKGKMDQISQKLQENNGWFQGIIDNEIYNTIGNITKTTEIAEQQNGWTFVGYYSVTDYSKLSSWQKSNLAIFKKNIMSFLLEEDPWQLKNDKKWLPKLGYITKNNNKLQLTNSLGHNCPTIERKAICNKCGKDIFNISVMDEEIIGKCINCETLMTIWNNSDTCIDYINEINDISKSQIIYFIEYPVDAYDGTDLSWISIFAKKENKMINIADGEM